MGKYISPPSGMSMDQAEAYITAMRAMENQRNVGSSVLAFDSVQKATEAWARHKPHMQKRGINLDEVVMYRLKPWKEDFRLAMDALPTLSTDPNSAIPSLLTTSIDPEITRIMFTPNEAAEIFGEKRSGNWLDQPACSRSWNTRVR